jgi:hypothetical protein
VSTFPRVPTYSEEWGERFITTMRDYTEGLERAVDEDGVAEETLSGHPFCGCSDCYERETYLMAMALTIEGYQTGEVRLADAK